MREASGERRALLLDCFDHPVETAPIVGDLLERCLRLAVLSTKRVRLRLSREREHVLPLLALASPATAHSLAEDGRIRPTVIPASADGSSPDRTRQHCKSAGGGDNERALRAGRSPPPADV